MKRKIVPRLNLQILLNSLCALPFHFDNDIFKKNPKIISFVMSDLNLICLHFRGATMVVEKKREVEDLTCMYGTV
jgi:hypothetical protein